MPRTRVFNAEAYAKTYYQEYYQKNKSKLNAQRHKNATKKRFKEIFNLDITDEQYELYHTYKALYDDLIKMLQRENYPLFVKKYNSSIRDLLDSNFVEFLKTSIKPPLTSSCE